MLYVDGFVAAVPQANKEAYQDQAKLVGALLKEHGATSMLECWEDDVPEGKVTSFPMAVKRQEGEAVVFSWITWPSKAVREAGMAKAMEDPRMQDSMNSMPFDGKRLIYGGFTTLVEL